jgi:hypothetical protein
LYSCIFRGHCLAAGLHAAILQKTHGIWELENFHTVLRVAGETDTMQENIQDWLDLDEGDPGFYLLQEETTALIYFYLFSSVLPTLLNFPFICFLLFC